MQQSTTVEAVRPTGVARYQVRYTCLDSEGDEQAGSDPLDGIAEADLECARILAYQESRGLPEDARIWWRVGAGPWQPWGGVL